MEANILTGPDYSAYDAFVTAHPRGSVFQTRKWREYQWTAFARAGDIFVLEEEGNIRCSALVMFHSLPLGKRYAYLPRGPLLSREKKKNMILLDTIRKHARQAGAIFVLMDPLVEKHEGLDNYLDRRRLVTTTSHQPKTTLVLDMRKSEDELLEKMKEKGRYNIGLAQRKGVEVRPGSVGELYPLLMETATRDDFSIHDIDTYEAMMNTFGPDALLLVAQHGREIIAGGIFLFGQRTAVYYYGASSSKKRSFMAPYIVQWEAIREAKRRKCTEYDFLGISDPGAPNHPLDGVTEFKTKFGGQAREYVGAKKIILSLSWNKLYEFWQEKKVLVRGRHGEGKQV